MSALNKDILLDLNFRTALLESVDWNENQSASLLEYLCASFRDTSLTPDNILEHVENEYGSKAHNFIKEMFLDVYIENGLYIKTEEDYEH